MADLHGQMSMFWTLIFQLDSLDSVMLLKKKKLTFVDYCDKLLLNSSCKLLLSEPKARLITFFKTRLIKFYLNS